MKKNTPCDHYTQLQVCWWMAEQQEQLEHSCTVAMNSGAVTDKNKNILQEQIAQ